MEAQHGTRRVEGEGVHRLGLHPVRAIQLRLGRGRSPNVQVLEDCAELLDARARMPALGIHDLAGVMFFVCMI